MHSCDLGAGSWSLHDDDLRILGLLAAGHTVATVARLTGASERTVRRRLRAVCDELGVGSTMEAVVHAVRAGLI